MSTPPKTNTIQEEIDAIGQAIAEQVDVPGVPENIEPILISGLLSILVAIALICCKWF